MSVLLANLVIQNDAFLNRNGNFYWEAICIFVGVVGKAA